MPNRLIFSDVFDTGSVEVSGSSPLYSTIKLPASLILETGISILRYDFPDKSIHECFREH